MSRLSKYALKSKVGLVRLEFEGEKFLFNLAKEVRLTRLHIDKEIIEHPPIYGFLTTLHKKLILKCKEAEIELEKVSAERFLFYLTSQKSRYYKDMASYPNSTTAKELVKKDVDYLRIAQTYVKLNGDKDIIESCVKAFEQRAFLLQTLSANNRKQIN
jgi:hypothetical protein